MAVGQKASILVESLIKIEKYNIFTYSQLHRHNNFTLSEREVPKLPQ